MALRVYQMQVYINPAGRMKRMPIKARLEKMTAYEAAILRDFHLMLRDQLRIEWLDKSRLSPKLLKIVNSEKPPSEKMSELLTKLPKHCSMLTFLNIIITSGQDYLAEMMVKKIIAQCTIRRSEICHEKIEFSFKLQKYERLAHRLQVEVYNTNNKKQKFNLFKKLKLKRKMVLKKGKFDEAFAYVNAILDTERTWTGMKQSPLHQSKWFKNMEILISKTSCPEHAESIFRARYAAALALDGHLDGGLRNVTFAMECLDLDHCARWNVNVIYAFINILLQIYTNEKTRVCRGKIIGWILTCAKQAESLSDDMKEHWLGMLEMKKVFVYLGIGIKCQRICGVEVTDEDLAKADESLKVIDSRFFQKFDCNRKNYYKIASKTRSELMEK